MYFEKKRLETYETRKLSMETKMFGTLIVTRDIEKKS